MLDRLVPRDGGSAGAGAFFRGPSVCSSLPVLGALCRDVRTAERRRAEDGDRAAARGAHRHGFPVPDLALHVWPRPAADLQEVTLRIAPGVEGTRRADVLLRLPAAPRRRGAVSRVRLEQPALVARVPAWTSRRCRTIRWRSIAARSVRLSVALAECGPDSALSARRYGRPRVVRLPRCSSTPSGWTATCRPMSIEATLSAARANLWRSARAHWQDRRRFPRRGPRPRHRGSRRRVAARARLAVASTGMIFRPTATVTLGRGPTAGKRPPRRSGSTCRRSGVTRNG